jgi:hypothetical protein
MESTKWYLNTKRWRGPDRVKWKIDRDVVEPSPDGRFACVLYSCHETRLGCEAGLLTLLSGPPESPKVLLQPRGFTCFDFSPRSSAQWLGGSRFVVVTAYIYPVASNRIELLAWTFLDTVDRTFALHEIPLTLAGARFRESGDEWLVSQNPNHPQDVRLSAGSLTWRRWWRLPRW